MTLVHRHIRGAETMTDRQYLDAVIDNITPEEWRLLAQLPPIPRPAALVCNVIALRQTLAALRYPTLAPNHPLKKARP